MRALTPARAHKRARTQQFEEQNEALREAIEALHDQGLQRETDLNAENERLRSVTPPPSVVNSPHWQSESTPHWPPESHQHSEPHWRSGSRACVLSPDTHTH